ncbi:histidine kinase [Glaciihabitans sp. UYNi722]|uniref:sensor histidine kinase n=1 Tax=Glaciihabitans sp. UYNi722 TaxID=3156344 RepID=UPI003394DEDC
MDTLRMEAQELAQPSWPPWEWLSRRPIIFDWVVVLASVVPPLIALVFTGDYRAWLGYLTLTVTAIALFWRRKSPLAVLTIVVIASSLSPLARPGFGYPMIPFAFALYAVASLRPFSRAAIGYGIGILIPLAVSAAQLILGLDTAWPTLLDPFALLALALGLAVRNRRQRRIALTELVNERIENAAIIERAKITAEMHDVVAHSITIMIALANGASVGWQKHPQRATEALDSIASVGRSALTDMHRILQLLSSTDTDLAENLHESGHNLPTLEELAEVFRIAGLQVNLVRTGTRLPDDTALALTIYRIVQESLTNILRHAHNATHADVEIAITNDDVDITVIDDGASQKPPNILAAGQGLIGIRERSASYDGSSDAGPLPVRGWRTHARLYLKQPG